MGDAGVKVFGKFVDSDQKRATLIEKIAESTIRCQGSYEFKATHDLVMEYRACNGNRETFRPHHAQCPLWVISRHFPCLPKMSAFGGKADVIH